MHHCSHWQQAIALEAKVKLKRSSYRVCASTTCTLHECRPTLCLVPQILQALIERRDLTEEVTQEALKVQVTDLGGIAAVSLAI